MKPNVGDKLYTLENGCLLSMNEIEELTMLLLFVQADPDNSKHYPFGSVRSAGTNLKWLGEINGS